MIGKKSLKEIDKMKGLDFEVFVGQLLEQHGYKTQNIKGSGDFGVDVIAEKRGVKFAVQVKRYQSKVSRTAISDAVAGKFHWDCEKAWVVTNSYFTSDAKILAKSTNCKLTDRDDLKKMMQDGSSFASIFEGSKKPNRRKRSPLWGTFLLIGLAALAFYFIRFVPQQSFERLWHNTTSFISSLLNTDANASPETEETPSILLETGDSLRPVTPVEPEPTPLIPSSPNTGNTSTSADINTPISELSPSTNTSSNNEFETISTTDLQPIENTTRNATDNTDLINGNESENE